MAEHTYEQVAGLQVATTLHRFIEDEALPGSASNRRRSGRGSPSWSTISARNAALLARREDLQRAIDGWHREHPGAGFDPTEYRAFLEEIEYLEPEGPDFLIDTEGVDPEIAEVAGRNSSCRWTTRATRSTPPTRAGGRSTTPVTAPT